MFATQALADQLLEGEFDVKQELMAFGRERDAAVAAGLIDNTTVRLLRTGDTLYHRYYINADGSPVRARVTGKVRTWARDPSRFEVPWKHGMYAHGTLTPDTAGEWTTVAPADLTTREVKQRRRHLGKRWDDRRVPLSVQETDARSAAKRELMADPEALKHLENEADVREYIASYLTDYLPKPPSAADVERVFSHFRTVSPSGFPDMFAVFSSAEAVGLGRAAEMERQFFGGNG